MTSPQVTKFLGLLDGVRKSGDNWTAHCPCRNDDKSPTLSVGEGRDGRVLVKCHRGGNPCTMDEICKAVGVEVKDLHPNLPPKDEQPAKPSDARNDLKLQTVYDYTDAFGNLVFQVLRFKSTDGRKEFRQRVPDATQPKGWKYSTTHLEEKPLYRLPELLHAIDNDRIVFVAEGEKDVDALWEAGYPATCNPMGADNGQGSKWKPNHTESLDGARIIILADNDEPGLVHANYVFDQLVARGKTQVKIKRCPDGYKDAYDLLAAGLSVRDLIEVRSMEPPQESGTSPEKESGPSPENTDGVQDAFLEAVHSIIDMVEWDASLGTKITKATSILQAALPQQLATTGRLITWREFIGEAADDSYDWLIDGVLERQERVMIVAAEGAGKTTLARQVAMLTGAGIHPFNYTEIRPIRTLLVDLENPEKIIRRQSRKIMANIDRYYSRREHHSSLWTKPDGINVLKAADRMLLEQQIEATACELLVLGPIYKSFIDPGSKSAESVAIEVATYFDYLRATYGVALWLEHHAPLGNSLTGRDLRPMGSAVWMRWPEFGFALAQDPTATERIYDFKQWRGPRDVRTWPAQMRRGDLFPFEVLTYTD